MEPLNEDGTLPSDNGGNVVVGIVCLVCSLATIAVGLRFYTRYYLLKHLGPDDYLVLVALAFTWLTGISQCINTRHGLGAHVWTLTEGELQDYYKNFFASIALYNSGLLFVKMTFLAQYYRVLAVERIRILLIAAMVVVGSWSLSQVLVGIFMCTPVAGFWDKSLEPTCIAVPLEWYINSAGNIATDIVIFVLPMPILGHLRLPRAEKLVLVGIFSLGFFTCAISVIRMKYLKQGGDRTYENIGGSSWSITELASGVLCACLPTLRPLVSKCMPSLSRRLHGSSRGYRNYYGSHPADVEKGDGNSKHTRNTSDATDRYPMTAGPQQQQQSPGLRGPGIPGLYDSDESEGGLGSPSSERGAAGHHGRRGRYDFVALTPWQAHAQRLAREPSGAGGTCPRMEPQVTTEISPSHSPPPLAGPPCPNSAICVKHVVIVESDF